MRPILTLLSDFGSTDHYVGAVKGVILSSCPDVTLVDICHEVDAHDIFGGALLLRHGSSTFPEGTVHLAVVDPGVGTGRLPLLIRTERYIFVGPDNGLLSLALEGQKILDVCRIEPTWEVTSRTFHGRDVFAPAAGRAAAGKLDETFLKPVESFEKIQLPYPTPLVAGPRELERWQGSVLRIDRFGNLITNLFQTHFGELFEQHAFELSVKGGTTLSRLTPSYDEAPEGAPVVIWGSSGTLEISIREFSAARVLGIERAGGTFEIAFRKEES